MFVVKLLVVLILLALPAAPLHGRSAPICRPYDAAAQGLRKEMERYASAPSGENATVRQRLGLPYLTGGNIFPLTEESTCRKASSAYQSVLRSFGSGFSGQVYVILVGNVYAVVDPAFHSGPDTSLWTVVVLDSRFRKLSIYHS